MNDVKHFASPPSLTNDQIDYILLDGSSSMHGQWYDVLNSIDAYVDETKRAQELSSQVLFAISHRRTPTTSSATCLCKNGCPSAKPPSIAPAD